LADGVLTGWHVDSTSYCAAIATMSRSGDARREWFNFRGVVPAAHATGQHRV